VLSTRRSGSAFVPYLLLASVGDMCLVGFSGVMSRSLVHLSFQIRYAHSDIIIRSRWVAPWRIWPFGWRAFRRGRAMIVVMSKLFGHVENDVLHRFRQ